MQPRFTFVVDDVFQLNDGGVVAAGFVRGTVEKGNRVYVIAPDGAVRVAFIDGIATDGTHRVNSATDTMAALTIESIIVQDQLPLLSVITSVEPVLTNAPKDAPFENPYLEALIWEAVEPHLRTSVSIFRDQLVKSVREGRYLLLVEGKDSNGETIKEMRLSGFQEAGFLGLNNLGFARLFLGTPDGDKQEIMPLFTGYSTLPLDEEGNSPIGNSTMLVSFEDACRVRQGEVQLVVNPFGPVQLSLTGLDE